MLNIYYYFKILKRITFWWIDPLILLGFRKTLTKEDMWSIDENESCKHLTEKLETEWYELAERYVNSNNFIYLYF